MQHDDDKAATRRTGFVATDKEIVLGADEERQRQGGERQRTRQAGEGGWRLEGMNVARGGQPP